MIIGAVTIWQPPRTHVLWTLAGLLAALAIGTGLRLISLHRTTDAKAGERRASLVTWWVLALIMASAVVSGPVGVSVLLCLASGLAYREYAQLTGLMQSRAGCIMAFAGLLALHVTILATGARPHWSWLVPGLLVAGGAALGAWPSGRRSARSLCWVVWGALVLIAGPACALLLYGPAARRGFGGSTEAVLCLLILTEFNDITQALVGRRFGVTRVTPVISPRKTWEGLLGGMLLTSALAALLIPWLSSGGSHDHGIGIGVTLYLTASVVGLVVAISGFLGDINMSAYKRAAGVKDASTILPGQGGVLDRIDSLTLAAPAFYCSTRWLLGD
jgi:phosphatidate cytidylyltransferase